MRERTVEGVFARVGKRRGVLVVKMTPMGWIGWPDRLCLAYPGRAAFAELKAPGETPKRHQRIIHKRLRRLGFLVGVIDHPDDVEPFYDDWLGPC